MSQKSSPKIKAEVNAAERMVRAATQQLRDTHAMEWEDRAMMWRLAGLPFTVHIENAPICAYEPGGSKR